MTATHVFVKLAEIQAAQGATVFCCVGLGSCVGVALFDPIANIGGMAHVMLPEVNDRDSVQRPGKYADTAIPKLIDTMERLGAERTRMLAAYAGGAEMCCLGSGSRLALGARNTNAVRNQLEDAGISCVAADVGGHHGRTITFESTSGKVLVRSMTAADQVLCSLK